MATILTPRLEQRQKLAMTAQMQQSLAILQMNQSKLEEHLEEELETNPFLELDRSRQATGQSMGSGGDRMAAIENSAARVSLADHLSAQLPLLQLSDKDRIRADYLIGHIDDGGYLLVEDRSWSQILHCTDSAFKELLSKLQSLTPTGVFAHDLAECLRLQLIESNRFDPMIAKVLDRLDLVGKMDVDALMRHCSADEGDVIDMIEEIHALDPRPGATYSTDYEEPRPPDVLVITQQNGDINLRLNPECFPKLRLNSQLFDDCIVQAADQDALKYNKSKFQSAKYLMRAVERRSDTLLRVAENIISQQKTFFQTGKRQDMNPLRQSDVSDALKLNVSTVNRAIAGKSFLTNWGVFDPRVFFPHLITTDMGSYSSEQLHQALKDLIAREIFMGVKSDDALADALLQRGFPIARRTVAKYRDLLGIPTASVRKRAMRLKAPRRF